MSIFALLTGVLFNPPEQRTSKTGKDFVAATIRVKDGDALQWVRIVAFSETARAELMRLSSSDALSVQGSFKAELYRPDGGEPKLSLSIVADQVVALRQPSRERKPKAIEPSRQEERGAGSWSGPDDGPNDQVPF